MHPLDVFFFAIQEVCGSLNLDNSSPPIHPFSSLTSSFKIQIFLTLELVSLASTLYDATSRLYTTLHRDSHLNTHTQGRSQEFVFFSLLGGANHANLYKNLIKI